MRLGLSLISDSDIKGLQFNSLTNEDRKEQLRQTYIRKRGKITKDDFTGFMMSAEFPAFLQEANQLSML